jgi:hypothetical protein
LIELYAEKVDQDITWELYDIYNKGLDNLVAIEWNRTTNAGRVQNPEFFKDTERHYWDEQQQDIPAPQ